MKFYKYRWIVFCLSVLLSFVAFQNCSQHAFVSGANLGNSENLSSEFGDQNYNSNNQLDNGLSGQLLGMDDNGAIQGVLQNDNGGTQINFYILEDDGGKQYIGQTVTDDGQSGTDELGTFEFTVPFEFACKALTAFAVDSDDQLTQLGFGPNFQLWGVNSDDGACKGITPPPHIDIIFPGEDVTKIGGRTITILGRCQPDAGNVSLTGDISPVTVACDDNNTFQAPVVFKHPQQVNKVTIKQASANGMVATDNLAIFLDVALPPPPPPPKPPSSGGDGGGYN